MTDRQEPQGGAKLLIDLGPLLVFFLVNFLAPVPAVAKIFVATGAFMIMSGPAHLDDKWCKRSAINSLPVPRSPITRTGRLSGAARLARSTASRNARLWPMN